MLSLSDISSICAAFILYFVSASSLLAVNKKIRARRGALSKVVNFNDIKILFVASLFVTVFLAYTPWLGLSVIVCVLFFLYGVLVWLDAILFVQYRIEINRQSFAWFFTGSKGLAKGIPHLLVLVKQIPYILLLPLAWASVQVCVLYIFALPKGIFSEPAMLWLVGVTLGIIVAISALAIYRIITNASAQFYTAPSLLANIIMSDKFSCNKSIEIDPRHQPFVKPEVRDNTRGDLYGACKGANIILITMESLGYYLDNGNGAGVRSKLKQRFQANSWEGKKHYCLCPNTTVATNQIYSGNYSNNPYNKQDSLYPGSEPLHLQTLKKNGYTTMFLDSADIALYDYHKLLNRIGFDFIWGTHQLPSDGLKADYRLWNMVEPVANAAKSGPFFLHIINDQSHIPYETIDKKTFNRHKSRDAKSQYMNAVEEADFIIDEFLNRLAEKVDLSNTILVFTGDHGESFGEYGYSFHSNSVILPQMHVPLFMRHPKLSKKVIEHSCHFDLFPTFFDLLGIGADHPHLGASLLNDDRAFAYFFHSATLKGNTPANFGFLNDEELLWVDRLFNQVKRVQKGQSKTVVQKEEQEYISSLLHRMLIERSLAL